MQVVETVAALRAARAQVTVRVGLVPTMGALHAGHLSLVEQARAECDAVMVSIFVNPAQFGPNEDLSRYPRDLPHDFEMLQKAGVDVVFTPIPDEVYPPGFQTWVEVTEVTRGLEGERRPGHFKGVATVVAKLFHQFQPHAAYFGQKDAQQVAVIKRMVRDLDFPLEMVVCPTMREADGLAMSSRNVYLNPEQRQAATVLSRALRAAGKIYDDGIRHPEKLRAEMLTTLQAEPLAEPEYVSAADARTLQELTTPGDAPVLLSMAVRVGTTRLIDNMLLPLALNTRAGLTQTLGG
ncbi:MAG TPA: pantoate--beta-alanine ligase [Phototrophicaceae bacterium]|nr:pantoate--beta-alanine ligase [Phototrophicaceae bacterium]